MTVRDLLETSINVFDSKTYCKTSCRIRSKTGRPLEYDYSDFIINSPYGNCNVNNWSIKNFYNNVINEIEIEVADV